MDFSEIACKILTYIICVNINTVIFVLKKISTHFFEILLAILLTRYNCLEQFNSRQAAPVIFNHVHYCILCFHFTNNKMCFTGDLITCVNYDVIVFIITLITSGRMATVTRKLSFLHLWLRLTQGLAIRSSLFDIFYQNRYRLKQSKYTGFLIM